MDLSWHFPKWCCRLVVSVRTVCLYFRLVSMLSCRLIFQYPVLALPLHSPVSWHVAGNYFHFDSRPSIILSSSKGWGCRFVHFSVPADSRPLAWLSVFFSIIDYRQPGSLALTSTSIVVSSGQCQRVPHALSGSASRYRTKRATRCSECSNLGFITQNVSWLRVKSRKVVLKWQCPLKKAFPQSVHWFIDSALQSIDQTVASVCCFR